MMFFSLYALIIFPLAEIGSAMIPVHHFIYYSMYAHHNSIVNQNNIVKYINHIENDMS